MVSFGALQSKTIGKGVAMPYIWENPNWPDFKIEMRTLQKDYERYLYQKGLTDQVFSFISPELRNVVYAQTLSNGVVSSNEIEGVSVSYDSVYSSVAKALAIESFTTPKQDRYAQILAEVSLSVQANEEAITEKTILNWHKLLFEGVAPAYRTHSIGEYRNGPVYIMNVSGSMKNDIIYEGVPADRIKENMDVLVKWIHDHQDGLPAIARSAIASIWFVSIHPFEDGNGRISRLLADAIMAQHDSSLKYCSVSSAILKNKKEYYNQLYEVQRSQSMDVSAFVAWYIKLVSDSLLDAERTCKRKIALSQFMASLDPSEYNSREISMLYKLASGSFYGKLTAEKWCKLTKCQSATATRDLSHLVEKGLLRKSNEGGRSSWYYLNDAILET